jgi:hypothetical protein
MCEPLISPFSHNFMLKSQIDIPIKLLLSFFPPFPSSVAFAPGPVGFSPSFPFPFPFPAFGAVTLAPAGGAGGAGAVTFAPLPASSAGGGGGAVIFAGGGGGVAV